MQAIKTKYIGPSNSKGSRIQASCEAKTIYVSYNHALDSDGNHRAACEELLRALGWTADQSAVYSDLVGGWYGDSYFWVFANSFERTTINSSNEHEVVNGKLISIHREVAA